ncbi:hypothetical protein SUDANB15_00427 [Streptomyces sp. enrichment culture]
MRWRAAVWCGGSPRPSARVPLPRLRRLSAAAPRSTGRPPCACPGERAFCPGRRTTDLLRYRRFVRSPCSLRDHASPARWDPLSRRHSTPAGDHPDDATENTKTRLHHDPVFPVLRCPARGGLRLRRLPGQFLACLTGFSGGAGSPRHRGRRGPMPVRRRRPVRRHAERQHPPATAHARSGARRGHPAHRGTRRNPRPPRGPAVREGCRGRRAAAGPQPGESHPPVGANPAARDSNRRRAAASRSPEGIRGTRQVDPGLATPAGRRRIRPHRRHGNGRSPTHRQPAGPAGPGTRHPPGRDSTASVRGTGSTLCLSLGVLALPAPLHGRIEDRPPVLHRGIRDTRPAAAPRALVEGSAGAGARSSASTAGRALPPGSDLEFRGLRAPPCVTGRRGRCPARSRRSPRRSVLRAV